MRRVAASADLPPREAADSDPSGVNAPPLRPLRDKPVQRGYVRGCRAAADYCGVDRKTFRSWRDDVALADGLRGLLKPRIIRGESYYRIANLDRFMDPVNNLADEDLTFHGRN